jgi:hypothetical protein
MPERVREFFSSPYRLWIPFGLMFNGLGASSPACIVPRRDIAHSPPSRAEVKNEQSLVLLHDVHRGTFTFICSRERARGCVRACMRRAVKHCTTFWHIWKIRMFCDETSAHRRAFFLRLRVFSKQDKDEGTGWSDTVALNSLLLHSSLVL